MQQAALAYGACDSWCYNWQLYVVGAAGDVFHDPELLIPGVGDRKNLAPLYSELHTAIRQVCCQNRTVLACTPPCAEGGGPLLVLTSSDHGVAKCV